MSMINSGFSYKVYRWCSNVKFDKGTQIEKILSCQSQKSLTWAKFHRAAKHKQICLA